MRGKNFADAQIKEAMLGWGLAKKWEMTSAKLLLYKEKTEKKPWMVLISTDYGNKRVQESFFNASYRQ
jgi:hypothetical protein